MKTIKRSLLAALACICLATSCTKENLQAESTTVSAPTDYLSAATARKAGGEEIIIEETKGTTASPQQELQVNNGSKPEVSSIGITLNPNPAFAGSTVTLTGNIAFPIQVSSGKVVIERAVDLDASGNFIGYTSSALAENWVPYAEEIITTPTSNYTITKTFAATEVGLFGWRLHFIPARNAGVKAATSKAADLEVKQPCNELKLAGQLVKATPLGNNQFEFEVAYRVTSCIEVISAKLQGGLTAVTTFNQADTYPLASGVRDTRNNNHIITWNLGSLSSGYNQTYTLKFVKTLKGEAPWQLTGDWSVEGINAKTNEAVRVEFASITFQN